MLIGYARISKADGSQSLDLQRDALIAAGVPAERIYEDQASGARDDRPGLEACLRSLREGDVLVVWKLDRLGRTLTHLVNTVRDLLAAQGLVVSSAAIDARGDREQVEACERQFKKPVELQACLLPNRRVQVELAGTKLAAQH